MLNGNACVRLAPASDPAYQMAYRRYALQPHESMRDTALECNLLVAHGVSLCKEVYEPILSRISSVRGDAISYEVRNHGDSGVVNAELLEENSDLDAIFYDSVRDTRALINTLRLTKRRPLIGIGHSGGGTLMLCTEIMYPGTFEAIIVIDPILSATAEALPARNSNHTSAADFGDVMANMALHEKRTVVWLNATFTAVGLMRLWAHTLQTHGLRDLEDGTGVALKCTPHQEAMTFLSRMHPMHNVYRRISDIRIPVLFISAEHSELMQVARRPVELLRATAARCRQGRHVMVPNVGHMLPLQDPNAVANVISQFIRDIRRNTTPIQANL
ncbi:Alpha/Beta hydrolase protein [Thamnocephalis sphaerospora]|uniref:Alpha/Beta hydrolase protein n=1 Tax=Thamnocephalis sphaerospora TaxID=78915 RepID=A0A4P9XK80_9FUNG|nr:Alpha/Beta hydrolase protein [Thamnocephalis sphaerospora]|eukprot:RKP06162.1 Alpha/Beta hydrolase protein [Thamnocephalis sphaerospora]